MLYEIAPVFDVQRAQAGDLPHEQPSLVSIGAYGNGVDFYLIRDIVIDILSQFGVRGEDRSGAEPYHHPGRAAKLMAGDRCIATVAEAAPRTSCRRLEIPRRTIIAEVNLEMLCELHGGGACARMPRVPAVTRDIAGHGGAQPFGSVLHVRKTGGALAKKQCLTSRRSAFRQEVYGVRGRHRRKPALMQKILAARETAGAAQRVSLWEAPAEKIAMLNERIGPEAARFAVLGRSLPILHGAFHPQFQLFDAAGLERGLSTCHYFRRNTSDVR